MMLPREAELYSNECLLLKLTFPAVFRQANSLYPAVFRQANSLYPAVFRQANSLYYVIPML
jgi:hypothetical protein